MIKAVFNDGIIYPLDPSPPDWSNGQQLRVEETALQPPDKPVDGDGRLRDMAALTAELDDPLEWAGIESTLAEADQQAKALVRRDMGLP